MKPLRPFLKNTTAGYTLIEVLAVVVIVGILAAIAAPSWLAYANRQRVRAVESDLIQYLQRSQQKAIKERQEVAVGVSTVGGMPVVTNGGAQERLGPADLQANVINVDTAVVPFDYKGMVTDNSVTLPIVINITPANGGNIQHCVMVTSILGNLKSSREAAVCNNPAL